MNQLPDLSAVERQPWALPAPTDQQRNLLTRADLVARGQRFDQTAENINRAPMCEDCGVRGHMFCDGIEE